jgi:hypothetical protein
MAPDHLNSFQPIASEIIQMSEKDQAMEQRYKERSNK